MKTLKDYMDSKTVEFKATHKIDTKGLHGSINGNRVIVVEISDNDVTIHPVGLSSKVKVGLSTVKVLEPLVHWIPKTEEKGIIVSIVDLAKKKMNLIKKVAA